MSTTQAPLTCPACRAIDEADGVADGHLYPVFIKRIGNERTILDSVKRAQDRAADRVTDFAGSLNFVYLHGVWFGIWILINIGLIGAGLAFDKFPFGLLTMIVSLEAIFLSTFVMISQNRADAKRQVIADAQWKIDRKSVV